MIEPGIVDVTLVRLTGDISGAECLSPDEQERACAFKFDRDRLRYTECHVRLRNQLAAYLETDPKSIPIDQGEFGKPFIPGYPIHFNLSHAGPYYAAAFCRDSPVGVDVESILERGNILDVAPSVFTATEQAQLADCEDEPAKQAYFLRLWTAKEAFLKATGSGLQVPPDKIQVEGDFLTTVLDGIDVIPWKLHCLESTSEHALSVVASKSHSVRTS